MKYLESSLHLLGASCLHRAGMQTLRQDFPWLRTLGRLCSGSGVFLLVWVDCFKQKG